MQAFSFRHFVLIKFYHIIVIFSISTSFVIKNVFISRNIQKSSSVIYVFSLPKKDECPGCFRFIHPFINSFNDYSYFSTNLLIIVAHSALVAFPCGSSCVPLFFPVIIPSATHHCIACFANPLTQLPS